MLHVDTGSPRLGTVRFVAVYTGALQACKRYHFSASFDLFGKEAKAFLLWTNSEIQTFMSLVTDDSARWELDDDFERAWPRLATQSTGACGRWSSATASAAIRNVKVHSQTRDFTDSTQ